MVSHDRQLPLLTSTIGSIFWALRDSGSITAMISNAGPVSSAGTLITAWPWLGKLSNFLALSDLVQLKAAITLHTTSLALQPIAHHVTGLTTDYIPRHWPYNPLHTTSPALQPIAHHVTGLTTDGNDWSMYETPNKAWYKATRILRISKYRTCSLWASGKPWPH